MKDRRKLFRLMIGGVVTAYLLLAGYWVFTGRFREDKMKETVIWQSETEKDDKPEETGGKKNCPDL